MHDPDKQLWQLWMGLMLITVVVLPFLARQEGLMVKSIQLCSNMFGQP